MSIKSMVIRGVVLAALLGAACGEPAANSTPTPVVAAATATASSSATSTPAASATVATATVAASPAAATSELRTGAAVVVRGAGTCLNVRAAATTSAQANACLPEGTSASIDDGPREADGYTWWHLRGQGWAASQFLAVAGIRGTPGQDVATPAASAPAGAAAGASGRAVGVWTLVQGPGCKIPVPPGARPSTQPCTVPTVSSRLTISADGTYTQVNQFGTGNGTWAVANGSTIRLTGPLPDPRSEIGPPVYTLTVADDGKSMTGSTPRPTSGFLIDLVATRIE